MSVQRRVHVGGTKKKKKRNRKQRARAHQQSHVETGMVTGFPDTHSAEIVVIKCEAKGDRNPPKQKSSDKCTQTTRDVHPTPPTMRTSDLPQWAMARSVISTCRQAKQPSTTKTERVTNKNTKQTKQNDPLRTSMANTVSCSEKHKSCFVQSFLSSFALAEENT